MLEGYRIKAFVPAGRKRTLEILFRYFQRNRHIIDEVMLWQNTPCKEYVDYLYEMEKKDLLFQVYTLPKEHTFFYRDLKEDQLGVKWGDKTVDFPVNKYGDVNFGPIQWNTGRFFEYCVENKTIYIRFDDDVVYLEDDYIPKIVNFRLRHPEYFLVFGNIWNNAVISWIHQQEGRIGNEAGTVAEPECMDMVGWGSGEFGEYIHEILLKSIEEGKSMDFNGTAYHKSLEWMGEGYEMTDGKRFSISNFAFFGEDFKKFRGKFPDLDEEKFLTEVYPVANGKRSVICNALVSHFTFSPYQKKYIMENTDLLKRYLDLSKKKYQEGYYNMLNTHDD